MSVRSAETRHLLNIDSSMAATDIKEVFGANGLHIHEYRREKILGRGGFGTVYKATVQGCPVCSTVAVKDIQLHLEKAERFHNEIEHRREKWDLLLRLRHDNIVPYHHITYERTPEGATVEFVMSYLEDGDLSVFISRRKDGHEGLTKQIVLDFALQLADGLAYLHQNRILHGDLKPENVLVKHGSTETGSEITLQIGDLDNFVLLQHSVTCSKDVDRLFGTFRFMSPEIINKFAETKKEVVIGRKTDLWSLGCVLHDLFDCAFQQEGRWLYKDGDRTQLKGDTDNSVIALKILDGYDPEISANIPRDLTHILRCCMCRDTTLRISAESLVGKLREYPREIYAAGKMWKYIEGEVIGRCNYGFCCKALMDKSNHILHPNEYVIKRLILRAAEISNIEKICNELLHIKQENLDQLHKVIIRTTSASAMVDLLMDYHQDYDLGTLVHYLAEEQSPLSLPLASALDCIEQIAQGLGYLHGSNIVLGSLGSSNILTRQQPSYRMICIVTGWEESALKQDDIKTGASNTQIESAIRYMSPELAAKYTPYATCIDKITVKTDIWSLGCIISDFSALWGSKSHRTTTYNFWRNLNLMENTVTSTPPEDSDIKILESIAHGHHPVVPSSIPSSLSQLMQGCLREVPDNRFCTRNVIDVCRTALKSPDMGECTDGILLLYVNMNAREDGNGKVQIQMFEPVGNTVRKVDFPARRDYMFSRWFAMQGSYVLGQCAYNWSRDRRVQSCETIMWNLEDNSWKGWSDCYRHLPTTVGDSTFYWDISKSKTAEFIKTSMEITKMTERFPHILAEGHYTSSLILDNQILIIYCGGVDSQQQPIASVDVFDTTTGEWYSLPSMSKPRTDCSIAFLDGYLYVLGSKDDTSCERLSFLTNEWDEMSDLPVMTTHDAFVANKTIYVSGLCTESGLTMVKYDVGDNTWLHVPLDLLDDRRIDGCQYLKCFLIKWPGWEKLKQSLQKKSSEKDCQTNQNAGCSIV